MADYWRYLYDVYIVIYIDAQQRGMFLADICDATGEIDLNKLLMQIKTCNPQNSPTLAEHMPLIFTLAYKYGCLKRRMKDGTKCSGKEKVDLPVLQPYDDKNPREFLEKFEMRYGGLETTSQHQLFKEYLSGGALIAYKALKIEDYNNFKEFADAWIENYKPNFSNKRREIILEQLLINNSRKADSPIQYINRLQGWINELSELRHLPDSEIAKYWLAAAKGLKRYDEIFDYYCSSNRENSLLKAKVLAALKKETQRDPTYKKENTGPSTTRKDFRKKVNLIECDKPIDVSDDDNKILNVYRLVLNGKKSVVVCNVQGKESNCLLDSGAEVSLITISKVKEIHPLPVIKKNPRIIVSDVQNQPLHLLGSVELLVEDILVSMLVVQSLNNIDAILGTNALSKSPVLQSKLQKLWSVNNISPDTTVEKLLSNYDVVASSGFHKPSSKIPPITFELLDEKPVQQKS
uniref:Peptidase A2 domain-containing protein n=1 Tax=Strongyloides papillosus TaxID=174720 RepID=A0A0N5BUZ2_STREA